MPTLSIAIREDVWPDVVERLQERFGEVPEGIRARDWAEQIAVQAFAGLIAEPDPPRTKSRIRPSRART